MNTNRLLILNGMGLKKSSLDDIEALCSSECQELNMKLSFERSEDPDVIIRRIEQESESFDALVLNPGNSAGETTPDYIRSITRAVSQLNKPVIEVHLDNIFRLPSATASPLSAPECQSGFVSGMGANGYVLAIRSIANTLKWGR